MGGPAAQQEAYLINWAAFRNTLLDWISAMSHINSIIGDQDGNMTTKDKVSLM
jgi:hypothetical protein